MLKIHDSSPGWLWLAARIPIRTMPRLPKNTFGGSHKNLFKTVLKDRKSKADVDVDEKLTLSNKKRSSNCVVPQIFFL